MVPIGNGSVSWFAPVIITVARIVGLLRVTGLMMSIIKFHSGLFEMKAGI